MLSEEKMKKKNLEIFDINEPTLFDFTYEEIRQQNPAEMPNIIIFEMLIRCEKIKSLLSEIKKNIKEDMQNLDINTFFDNSSPIYNLIEDLKSDLERLYSYIDILKEHNQELKQMLFNNDEELEKKAIKVLETTLANLHSIQLPEKINSLNNEHNSPQTIRTSEILKELNQFGIKYEEYTKYYDTFSYYQKQAFAFKENLFNESNKESININFYQKKIKKLINEYNKNRQFFIHSNNQLYIFESRRPINYEIETPIHLIIPFYADKAKKRIEEYIKYFKTIQENIKKELNQIQPKNYTINIYKPDRFARLLFIYDYIQYYNQTYHSATQEDIIEDLYDKYRQFDDKYSFNSTKQESIKKMFSTFNSTIKNCLRLSNK